MLPRRGGRSPPALAACGPSGAGAENPSSAAPVVAVLPAVWLTDSPMTGAAAGAAAVAGIDDAGVATIDPSSVVVTLDAPFDPTCLDEPACLRRLGQSVGAAKLLLVRLAGLGDTVAVRLVLVDVASGAEESSRQDVVHDATAERVAASVETAARSLAAPSRRLRRSRGTRTGACGSASAPRPSLPAAPPPRAFSWPRACRPARPPVTPP